MTNLTSIHHEIVERVARQNLMQFRLDSINQSTIYRIYSGWEKALLFQNEGVKLAADTIGLEDAVKNPDVFTIVIPMDARLTLKVIKTILARNPLSKTIFWEC